MSKKYQNWKIYEGNRFFYHYLICLSGNTNGEIALSREEAPVAHGESDINAALYKDTLPTTMPTFISSNTTTTSTLRPSKLHSGPHGQPVASLERTHAVISFALRPCNLTQRRTRPFLRYMYVSASKKRYKERLLKRNEILHWLKNIVSSHKRPLI